MASPEADADAKLMLAFQAGDRAAFESLFRRHTPALVSFLARMVKDRGRAEELAQEVFIRIYNARERYDALGYRDSAPRAIEPGGVSAPSADTAADVPATEYVLRGGSWADCAEACTVSFRSSRALAGLQLSPEIVALLGVSDDSAADSASRRFADNPNVGFRLCRHVDSRP